jgi:molybdenum cofactor synthesis domain-containing protein
MQNPHITAAILIIGNEITTGRTQDVNANFLAKELDAMGIELTEIRMIPDDETAIIKCVNELRKHHTYLFTTGGIGPTHDDITSTCIAKAFGLELERNPEIEDIISNRRKGYTVVPATYRMADIPKGAELIGNPVTHIPGFRLENVYVMAGVPSIMRGMFESIRPHLKSSTPSVSVTIDSGLPESSLADGLAAIQNHHQAVQIGSYPYRIPEGWRVSVVMRAKDQGHLDMAAGEVEKMIVTLGGTPVRL